MEIGAGARTLADRRLLADLARAYYLDNLSKVDIAQRFGITRFQVARLLDEARTSGIVSIEIHDPRQPRSAREGGLAAALGVETVRIVDSGEQDAASLERFGVGVLTEFVDRIRPGMTVGVAWSRTLDAAARTLPALPPCDLVQLTGAFEIPGSSTFMRMLLQLDRHGGVATHPLYAPLVVDEPATAEDLRRQPVIASTLERAEHLDLAAISIGAWAPGQSSIWDKVSDATRAACEAARVRAEFSGIFVDDAGRVVSTPLDRRTIGVGIEQLRKAGQVIGFARGAGRAAAVHAAVATGVFSVLVVDEDLAVALQPDAFAANPPSPASERIRAV